jgi:hypothetical protein
MIRRFARVTLAAVLGTALVAAVACGDNNDDGTPTQVTGGTPATQPGANPTVEIFGTPQPTATFTPEEATAVAAGGAVQAFEYSDPYGRYTVQLPEGWNIREVEERLATSVRFPGREGIAVLGFMCLPDATVEDLIVADQATLARAGLTEIDFSNERSIEVSGIAAREVPFRGVVGERTYSRIFVYFQGEECAWRIAWTERNGHPHGDLKPVYDRAVASFEVTAGG